MFLQQFIVSFFFKKYCCLFHNFISARLIIPIVVLYFIPVLHHVLKSQTTPPLHIKTTAHICSNTPNCISDLR